MNKNGFTLIELSVVLIIIGLVIGGVLLGRDMIESAKIRAQITQISDIETQINTFRLKYNCLPGDCPNATTSIGTTYNNYTINDSDGDGIIHSTYAYGVVQSATDCITPDATGEVSQLLLQLTAAGLGNYKANGLLNTGNATINVNYSSSAYGNGTGFFVSCLRSTVQPTYITNIFTSGNNVIFGAGAATIGRIGYGLGTYGKYFFGAYGKYSAIAFVNPIGIPADALRQIDEKIDDGLPNKGVVGIISGETACDNTVTAYPSPDTACRVTGGKNIR